jgi:hypothetical protein
MTSPLPPAPIGATISYGPNRVPDRIVMEGMHDMSPLTGGPGFEPRRRRQSLRRTKSLQIGK